MTSHSRFPRSQVAYEAACELIPGGVDSPVRAFKAVGGHPLFIANGQGAYLHDLDGNAYVDYVASWGPLLHGHAHPAVVAAIAETARSGTSFGAPCELETDLARAVRFAVPSMEKLRFVSSGTEATMSAIRVARGYTGRDVVLKFAGGYHGHGDCLLADAGSGVATLGTPACAGVPAAVTQDTWTAAYNDVDGVAQLLAREGARIAAVIVEPIAGNMGVVTPRAGFLEMLRERTRAAGSVLIFDEVMTGFRVAPGGAQERYGITPDLTTLGKIIGGGLPVGAYGGRADIMNVVAPLGPVYQAGTLSGNPLAMAAGLATLRLTSNDTHALLDVLADRLMRGLADAARAAGIATCQDGVGSMRGLFFCAGPVTNYAEAKRADTARYAAFFHGMLERGHYFAPSQFEAIFVSTAHTLDDIDRTIAAAREVFSTMGR